MKIRLPRFRVLLLSMALAACTKEIHVTKTRPFRELAPLLQRPARGEPFSSHHGFPVPRMDQGQLRLAVLSCDCVTAATEGLLLHAPRHVVVFDLFTGDQVDLRDASAELGERVDPNEEIGADRLAPGQSADNFVRQQELIYSAMDVLLPLYATGKTDVGPEQRKAARTFKETFAKVSEPVLQLYYRRLGKEWFSWIDQVVGS